VALSREQPNCERDGQYARNEKRKRYRFNPFPNSQCANFRSAPTPQRIMASREALTTPAGAGQPRTI
jgi:hypothetical protein